MISEHYHTNACKTDDAFTALMPTKRSKIFIKLFWDIIHTHTFNIPAIGDSRFTGGCFSGRGLEDECRVCTLHNKGYVLIEILTNYMYSTKYLPMYPRCISITSPDKGHTSSTPRGQYFQPNFRDPQRVPKAQCSQVLVIIWPLEKMSIFGVHPPIFSIGTGLSVLMQSSFDHFV
jgi:hypothetical protein